MEFADLIKISRLDNVRLRRAGEVASQGCDATVVVTGHHLILSLEESGGHEERELWLLHRMLLSVSKDLESQARSGTLTLRYKNTRTFYLDIIGADKFALLQSTLEQLSTADNPASSYPFFYNPGLFKALEDGWSLYTPDQEFLSLTSGNQDWRLSTVNNNFEVFTRDINGEKPPLFRNNHQHLCIMIDKELNRLLLTFVIL